jgi:hypothetical protein
MLRYFLYLIILTGGTRIFRNLDVLHYHEAFLASGAVAILALLLLEPRGKYRKALILLSLVISLYGLGLKLPMILQGRMNYYLAYFLALVLLAVVTVVIFVLDRKYTPTSSW